MSSPGAGQGVSWVDVAASAAGIYRQMESVGKEAAAGFSASFNSGVSRMGSDLSSTFSRAGGQAGASLSSGVETAFLSMIGRIIPGAEKIVQAFGGAGTNAGKLMSSNFMNEFNAGLSAAANLTVNEAFTSAFRSAGTRSAQLFSQEFTGKVASGLSALGGVSTANLEAALAGAGVRVGEQFTKEFVEGVSRDLSAGLSTLGGASMAEAVGRVMNGVAVHGGDIFVSGLSRRISAGMQVLSGENLVGDLVKSLGTAGEVGGTIWSRGFLQQLEIGMRNLDATINPSLDQLEKGLQAVGINLGSSASKMVGELFKGNLKAVAEQAVVPSVEQIKTVFTELGVEGDQQIATMATRVRASLMGMAGDAKVSVDNINAVMARGAVDMEAAWAGGASQAIGGWLAEMEGAITRVSGPTLAKAAGLTGTQSAKEFMTSFAGVLEAEAAGGLVTPEILERAFARVGAAGEGVQAASAIAGNILGTLKASLNTGLAGVMGKVESGLATLGGEGGLAAGLKIAGGIAAGITLGGEFVESSLKRTFDLANKEFSAFSKLASDAAETGMGAFKSVLEGKMPDVGRVIGVGLQGMQTAFELPLNAMNEGIDATVGHIPILGGIIKSVTGEIQTVLGGLFAAIQEYTSVASEFGNVMLDIGNKWQEAARTIAGQTLGLDHLQDYVGIVRDIASSGDLVHFKDVADVVGELGQRLSGLNGGVGLTREQLTELATTLAEGNELLGDIKINVDNLTAAFNSFDVPAEQTNQLLTEFVNIARMTGADINELTRDLDLMSPALHSMGLDAQDGAMMMGLLNEQLGKPALGRYSFAFSHLVEELHKTGGSMQDLVGIIQAYHQAGDDAGAVEYVMGLGLAAKAAENFVDQIKRGIIPTHQAMVDAFNAHRAELVSPLSEALEVTKQFKDTLEQLSNSMQGALAPLGIGLVSKLNGIGEHISTWLQEHQTEFIGWVGGIGEKLLEWGGKISHFLAKMLIDMSGTVEAFKNALVITVGVMDQAFIQMATPWEHIIPGLKGMVDGARDALPALKGLLNLDVGAIMRDGAKGMDALGNSLEGLEGPLAAVVSKSQDMAKFWEASRAEFAKADEKGVMGPSKLQDALGGSLKEGLTIAPDVWQKVVDQFAGTGVHIEGDPITGQIKKITANSKDELDKFTQYLNDRFGPEQFAQYAASGKVEFKVEVQPGKTAAEWLADNTGLPSELAGSVGADGVVRPKFQFQGLPPELQQALGAPPGTQGGPEPGPKQDNRSWWERNWKDLLPAWTPLSLLQTGGTVTGGHGGIDDIPAMLTAGETVVPVGASQRFRAVLDAMLGGAKTLPGGPVQNFQSGGIVEAAGIPAAFAGGLAGQGIALPATIAVATPSPMDDADALARAGIPDKYQGDVQSGGVTSTGVSLPTNLDVKTGSSKDAQEVMTSVGIPSSLQDSDGIKIGVKLNLTDAASLGGGGADGGAGGGDASAAATSSFTGPGSVEGWRPHVQAALMQGGGQAGPLGPYEGSGFQTDTAHYLGGSPGTWQPQVRAALMHYGGMAGIPPSAYPLWENAIMRQIATESQGDPNAINKSDSNWQAGHPSQGLLQFIPSTYAAHNLTGRPFPDPFGEIVATLDYVPKGPGGGPAAGHIGEGHGFQAGGMAGIFEGLFQGIAQQLGFQLPTGKGGGQDFWQQFGADDSGSGSTYAATGGLMSGGSGARASLTYHTPSHLAPHVGLAQPSGSIWKHMADGGHINGPHWPGRDTEPMNVPSGTFIMNRHRSAQYRDIIDRIMGVGYATGGMVPIIAEPGERVIPPGAAPPGLLHAMNSGALLRRAGGGGTGVLQVIYNPPGTNEYYGEAAGYGRVGPGTSQPQYYNADWGGHHGHVHTSFETGPSGEPYGMPVGTNLPATGKESSGFPSWVYQLGRQYGVYASTYPGHQEHGGKNHGLDWWPVGKADMSGQSYTPEERDRLRRFASAMVATGAGSGGPSWGAGYSSAGYSGGSGGGGGFASLRARLKAILPPWLSNALGLQHGGEVPGMPTIVPSPSGMLGGDGEHVEVDPDHPAIILVTSHGKGGGKDPNDPKTPEPAGPWDPGSSGNAPPPWAEKAKVPAGTAGAVTTPYGTFAMPTPDNMMGMTREEAKDFREWLHKQVDAGRKLTTDTTGLSTANQAEIDATTRLTTAKDGVTKVLNDNKAALDKMNAAERQRWEQTDPAYLAATKELTAAQAHEVETSKALGTAQTTLGDAQFQQGQDALSQPPWESKAGSGGGGTNQNAAGMGAGLVQGIGQELGFGDVFAKPPWEWGIWKLFAGGASFALNLANAMGDKAGGGGGGGFGGGGGGPFGGGLGGSSGPTPGPDASGGSAATGGDFGTLDPKTGAYTMANGEVDAPVGGGYAHAHGPADEWIFRKGRYYKKGTEPPDDGDSGGGGTPGAPPASGWPDVKTLGGDGWSMVDKDGHMLPPGQRELTKDGRGTGRVFANGKEIGGGGGAPKAAPPDIPRPGAPPKTEPGMAPAPSQSGPPSIAPTDKPAGWHGFPQRPVPSPTPDQGTGGQPSGGWGSILPRGVPGSQGAVPGTRFDTSGRGVETAGWSQGTGFAGGGGGGGGGGLGPMESGMLDYLERMSGKAITSAMSTSRPPREEPAGQRGNQQIGNLLSITTHNNGVLQGPDQAADLVGGAMVKRGGWTPSMVNKSVSA